MATGKILIVTGMQSGLVDNPTRIACRDSVVNSIRRLISDVSWYRIRFVVDYGVDGSHSIIKELEPFSGSVLGSKSIGDPNIVQTIRMAMDGSSWSTGNLDGIGYDLHIVGATASCQVLATAAILRSEFPNAKVTVHSKCIGDSDFNRKNAALVCLESMNCEVI